jgi:hypothetical protein
VGKRGIVATVKTDEERGHPAAAWAYNTRTKLELSDREVVDRLGKYDTASLRKAESNSENLSRPMWRALVPLYQQIAAERGIVLPVPPAFHESAPKGTGSDPALAEAIREQTRVMSELVFELRRQAEGQQAFLRELVAVALDRTREDPQADPVSPSPAGVAR